MRLVCPILLLLAMAAVPSDVSAQGYVAIDLGSGGPPTKVNSAGELSFFSIAANAAVLWKDGVVTETLGVFSPRDINNTGQVAGESLETTAGVLWTAGTTVQLPPLPGHTHIMVFALNDAGVVVGRSSGTTEVLATKWVNGTVVPLQTPAGHVSQAYDINNNGDIVGSSGPNGFSMAPTLWKADGSVVTMSELPPFSQPISITDAGEALVPRSDGSLIWRNGVVTVVAPGAFYMNNTGATVKFDHTFDGVCGSVRVETTLLRSGLAPRLVHLDDSFSSTQPSGLSDRDAVSAWRTVFAMDEFGCNIVDSRAFLFVPPPPADVASEIASSVESLLASGALSSRDATALSTQLDSAMSKLSDGGVTPGVNVLAAFINKVNALVNSGRMSGEDAQRLTSAAEYAIARAR